MSSAVELFSASSRDQETGNNGPAAMNGYELDHRGVFAQDTLRGRVVCATRWLFCRDVCVLYMVLTLNEVASFYALFAFAMFLPFCCFLLQESAGVEQVVLRACLVDDDALGFHTVSEVSLPI